MPTSKAPLKRENALESSIINLIAEHLYPREFTAGGSRKSNAKKRVRSAVRYARTTNRLEPPVTTNPPKVHLARFFQWAAQQWPELVKIENLLPDQHIVLGSRELPFYPLDHYHVRRRGHKTVYDQLLIFIGFVPLHR